MSTERSYNRPISITADAVAGGDTPFASSTIMIVDDEPTTIEMLEMFLQGEGYEHFVTTTEPREALAIARSEAPDVLLLDLMMPQVGGLEVLGTIRRDRELRHLPVVILTSSTESETKLKALEFGATDFLSKPVDPSELALRLKNTLAAKLYQDRLAYYDRLTGLPNRRLFMDRLKRSLERATQRSMDCALLHVDLDNFKQLNDTLGHSVGDELLQAVAQRLEGSTRPSDFLGVPGMPGVDSPLSRVDGDEFALLLPGAGAFERAARVARRILANLSKPFSVEGRDLFITASIGISLFPNDGETIESLLANANMATSHAKRLGRNAFQFYDASLSAESERRLELENALRRALERKELELHYQPKVNVKNGRITGAEALMRWEHPELGRVGPDQFIPVAEETGLIVPMGEWALQTACEQNQAWQDRGLPPISIAVNVSAAQLRADGFVETVRKALKTSRMSPEYLVLELTESMILDDLERMAAKLEEIKAMGVRISVDDFGTGYSSLTVLTRLPIDELKVDRSFVKDIPNDASDMAVVSAIIPMAHALGLKVVAEGVETMDQLEFLKGRHCDTYQGYLRSRPFPAIDFVRLIEGKA